jgi:hypothetical protein
VLNRFRHQRDLICCSRRGAALSGPSAFTWAEIVQRRGSIPTEYTGWLEAPLSYNLILSLDGCTLNFSGALKETAATGKGLRKTEAM